MTKEETLKKLNELFENKKSRNFINHLVREYFPIEKISRVENTPDTKNFSCAITNVTLVSINDVLNNVDNESQQRVLDFLDKSLSESKDKPELRLEDGREMCVRGKDTNTFISVSSYVVFHEWVLEKFLKGDKHMSWLLKDVKKTRYIKDVIVSKNGRQVEHNKPKSKGATFTLGDLGVLQELKNRMKNG